MAILPLVIAPDPRLKQVSEAVDSSEINDDLRVFMDNMLETMYEHHGLGLAAVQVGTLKRIITMDVAQGSIRYDGSHDENAAPDPLFIINPEITKASKETFVFEEGCLSFPTQFANIERPNKVTIKFLDYNGDEKFMDFEGLAAVCIQHEIDHLDGVTFVDYLSKMKKDRIIDKVKKIKKKLKS